MVSSIYSGSGILITRQWTTDAATYYTSDVTFTIIVQSEQYNVHLLDRPFIFICYLFECHSLRHTIIMQFVNGIKCIMAVASWFRGNDTTHWQCKLHILGEKILDTTHWQPKLHIFMVLTTPSWADGLAPLYECISAYFIIVDFRYFVFILLLFFFFYYCLI